MNFLKKLTFILILSQAADHSFAQDNFNYGISVFGDLKYPANFKHFDYVNPRAPKSGAVILGEQGSFNSLNPFILKGIAASGIDYLYDSLMESSQDEISAYYPLIAKGYQLSPDKLAMTFFLNENARFSDGQKVTADDVVFTFETLITKGHPSFKIAYQDIARVKKVNQHQVRFEFKNSRNKDLPFLAASMKILPQHFYQNHDFSSTDLENVIGSGAYKIKEVKMGKSIIYQRDKNYWARNLPVNVGRYNFDEIRYDYYLDANVMIEAFKAGEFDIRQENVARNWANSYDIDKIKNGKIIKQEIKHSLPAPLQTFILNLRREKFQDINLRQALTLAFNFEWLQKHIFYGSYQRTNSYFANSDFAYQNFQFEKSDPNGFGRKNLLEAQKILQNSGYILQNGKLISPITKRVVAIEFLIASKSFEMIIAPFIDNLRKLGIDARMKFVEENQFQTRLNNFDYDIFVAVYGQNLVIGSELLRYWHSSQANIKGSQNYSGLRDDFVDDLLKKIAATRDKKMLEKYCRRLDEYMLKNYFTIPQWYNDSYRILYKRELQRPKIAPKYALGFDGWWR